MQTQNAHNIKQNVQNKKINIKGIMKNLKANNCRLCKKSSLASTEQLRSECQNYLCANCRPGTRYLAKEAPSFPSVPSQNAGLPQIRPRPFLPLPFPIHFPLIILSLQLLKMFCHFKLSVSSAERLNSLTNNQIAIPLLPKGFILAFLLHWACVS